MGLSIHFSGRLRDATALPELIKEVSDIASVYKWKYKVYETNFPNGRFEEQTSFDNLKK